MDIEKLVYSLFQQAQEKNGIQYLFAILRPGGIESYKKDPLLVFKDKIKNAQITKEDILSAKPFWGIIANLSRIEGGYSYNPYVFWASESKDYLEESKKLVRLDLADYLNKTFPSNSAIVSSEQLDFIKKFLCHFDARIKNFVHEPKYYPLPKFEVLELLVDKKRGLYGFMAHFSNGSHAEFTRDSKGTSAVNLIPDPSGLGFMVGNLDEMKQEWRIGDKRLYEIGLQGRYNNIGEWTPIVYPGKSDHLQQEASEASEDERIQGILFYMFCTGYRVIEFAAKMAVKLPKEMTKLPGNIYLDYVPQESVIKDAPDLRNEYVYDGTLFLDDAKIETIKKGLDMIQRAMDGIAFTFSNPVKWKVKYTIKGHSPGSALPTEKDMTVLRKIVKGAQEEADITIDTAINWYKLGLLTDNKLNSFLCFHIAIEGLAVKLADGEIKASKFFGLAKENQVDKKKRIKNIFSEYYKNYYSTNLEKLINDAYFDCIGSITSNMKKSFKAVFGANNPVIDEYFKGDDSINSLRGKLAHGEYSDWHYEEYMKIWSKMWRVQEIAKGFITRVLLCISPGTKRPNWSGHYSFSMGMDRPTNTLVVTNLSMFPIKDWKIKADWID